METKPLLDIQRKPADQVLAGLLDGANSVNAGKALVHQARSYGLDMRDYLSLSVEGKDGMGGYEVALQHLKLPVRSDFDQGILLELASDTFNTFPGTRALFPEVVDDTLRWQDRSGGVIFDNPTDLTAVSRTVSSDAVRHTVVVDNDEDRRTSTIAEMARIPVRTIRTTEGVVAFHKHGSGYRTSYEFSRRARLDLLTPFANRTARELQKSKMGAALGVLINGAGDYGAAPVVKSKDFQGTTVAKRLAYEPLLRWLTSRAKTGAPIDTVVGNFKALVDWILLFTPTLAGNRSEAEVLAEKGGPQLATSVGFDITGVKFVLGSDVPDDQLVGFTKGETLEELIEAGSLIQESEQSITNQTMTFVRTENTGYTLVFGDTRSIFDYSEAST